MSDRALTKNQYHAMKIARAVTYPVRKVNGIVYRLKCKQKNFSSLRYKRGISVKQLITYTALLTGIVLASPIIRDLHRDITVPASASQLQEYYSPERTHIPNLPGWGNNSFTAPFWENEKASDRALADGLNIFKFKKDKKTFEQYRFDIAFENVQELTQKLAAYESRIKTVADYQSLSQEEQLKYASIYLGREIEIRQLIIYGQDPDITIEDRKRAAKESAYFESQWNQDALVSGLDIASEVLNSMPPNVGGPEAGKIVSLGGTKLGAILLNVFGKQVTAQIAKQAEYKVESQIATQIEDKLLNEIDKNIAKGIGDTISKETKDAIVANIGGITLRKGNWGQGLNHILVRHYTEEYLINGATTLFPKEMKPSEIVEIIKESLLHGVAKKEGNDIVIKAVFENERYGIKEMRVVLGGNISISNGRILSANVITAYPIRGSKIIKIYK